jgi:hypothetical protein
LKEGKEGRKERRKEGKKDGKERRKKKDGKKGRNGDFKKGVVDGGKYCLYEGKVI